MSATGVDARGYLAGWAGALVDMTGKDIRAIPDDKWQATHGGCSRSASSTLADTLGMLKWTTDAINGNVAKVEGGYVTDEIKASVATKDQAVAALGSSVEAFSAALKAADDATLNAAVMAPWGMETPLFILAQIAVSHIWYHDGQLNYIQTLLGDDKVHWMEA